MGQGKKLLVGLSWQPALGQSATDSESSSSSIQLLVLHMLLRTIYHQPMSLGASTSQGLHM